MKIKKKMTSLRDAIFKYPKNIHGISKRCHVLLLIILLTSSTLQAQKFTISGYVSEKESGENLVGVNVYVKELQKGTSTNAYGFYSLTLDKGEYTITASFIGKNDFVKKISLSKNISVAIALEDKQITTNEVTIVGEKTNKNVESTEMGRVSLPIDEIKSLPAFLGEVDILKTIQLLPGVQSAGEGNSGYYVRGGGLDQNLILLDEAVVYNASHLFGFFSIFNADAIRNAEMIKGGMPANYGGRLSSVLDISMKDGNMREYHAEGGIGLISSRLTVEGPIKKDTSAFVISGRRTYIDVLMKPFISNNNKFKGSGYYFYDLNAKINYRFSDKDRLYASSYFGRDVFSYVNKESGFNVDIPWGNATFSLRWNHLFSERLFVNTTAIYSDYKFQFNADQQDFEMQLFSSITNYNVKIDFTYLPNMKHTIKFGSNFTRHCFVPSGVSARIGESTLDLGEIVKQYANDYAIYVNDDFDATSWLKINAGLRATRFEQIGPFDRFLKDNMGLPTDTIHYEKGKKIIAYQHIEPRISARITLNSTTSLKAAYTQNYQYIHLASFATVSLPTDLWVPSSTVVKPQFGTLYSVGIFKNFAENKFETSIELYYKQLENQIEYAEGSIPRDNVGDNTDNNFVFGMGQSYGIELFIKKRYGKFTGWIGYTWSKTTRQFPDINNGNEYPAKYDRRHDLSMIATYNLSARFTMSAVFVYATGNCLTLPVSRYLIDGRIISEYGARNSYRMVPYHRLDLSATYTFPKKGRVQSSLNFSVYNAYNRYNPYFIYFENEGSVQAGTLKTTAKQVSLFPILPSVVWNFSF